MKKKNTTSSNKVIISKEQYEITMKKIDILMKKGEDNLNEIELENIRELAEAAEKYEDKHEPLFKPGGQKL
jgi:hypothetical protein